MAKSAADELLKEASGDEILTYEESARLLKVSKRTLEHRVRSKQLPFFRIGRAVRFSRNALLKHIYKQF